MGQQEDVPYFFPAGWGQSFFQQPFRPVDFSSSMDLFIVTMLPSAPYISQHSLTLTKVSVCIHDAAEFHSDFLAEQLYKCVGSIRHSNHIFKWVKSRLCGCPKVYSRTRPWISDTVFKPASTGMAFLFIMLPQPDDHFCLIFQA